MSAFTWTQSVAAGATYDPLDGWNYQYVPAAGVIKILHNATAVGMVATVTSGTDQLLQEAPVPGGGVAGTLPSAFSVPGIVDAVAPNDRISIRYRNTAGAAITVNGSIDYSAA